MSEISTEKLHIDELKKKLELNTTISVNQFFEFYKEIYGEIKKTTVRWYISELKKSGVIRNISRGHYVFENSIRQSGNEYIVITLDIIKSSKLDYKEFTKEIDSVCAHVREANK